MNLKAKIFILTSLFSTLALATTQTKEITVRTLNIPVSIHLSSQNVLCTAADYGAKMLKVNIPEIREYAHFDHTNSFTGLPCVQGGKCTQTNSPDALIAAGADVKTNLNIVLKQVFMIDDSTKTCSQKIVETIDVPINQIGFHHVKSDDFGAFPYDLCAQL